MSERHETDEQVAGWWVMTSEAAWELLHAHFSEDTIYDDPEWAQEMVAGLMDGGVTLDD